MDDERYFHKFDTNGLLYLACNECDGFVHDEHGWCLCCPDHDSDCECHDFEDPDCDYCQWVSAGCHSTPIQ